MKTQTFLKKRSGILWVIHYFKCELIPSQPYGWISEGVYFRRWFWLKKCSSYSKWPAVCIFVFLQILLTRRLIRVLLSCSITIAKLNKFFFEVSIDSFRMIRHKCQASLIWISSSFNMSWKYGIMMDYGKTKKSRMKINASIG